jgi:hypothetical protein
MHVIANEMFELVSGGAPATGNNSASSGNSTANCPPNTVPIALSGNVNATISGVTIGGSGGFATCIPFTPSGSGSGGGDGGNGSPDSTLKKLKKLTKEKESD